ncbi:MAG: Hpt domain-containing protein [Rhodocyclaceae bacterium]
MRSHRKAARSRFERGFLKWLRSTDGTAGLIDMREAVAAVERLQAGSAERSLWWITLGFFDVLGAKAIPVDLAVKRLCARIDTQMRRFADGTPGVAERLLRDLLYYIAIAKVDSPQLQEIQSLYRLSDLVPNSSTPVDVTPLRPLLSSLRDLVQQGKDAWNKFCAGAATGLPQLEDLASQLATRSADLPNPVVAQLLGEVYEAVRWLRQEPRRHNDASAMELATAMLLAENALENFAHLDEQFARSAQTVRERLAAVQRGEALAGQETPLLSEMSRRAQEKLLLAQVAREIQTSLAQIEQTLDGYFRDPSRSAELLGLSGPVKQVIGALCMLGQQKAADLLRECGDRIAHFATAETTPTQAEFEDIAHKVSGLGFFVEAQQYGPVDLDAILDPGQAKARTAAASSVEDELARKRVAAQSLMEQFKVQPENDLLRQELKQTYDNIRQEANLVADTKLERQAKEALNALAAAPGSESAKVIEKAGAEIAPPAPAPVPVPSAPAPETEEAIDQELLGIFLEEARDVLETIGSRLGSAEALVQDADALTVIRRGFHTLKGSGRMVGLKDLGEAAWNAEQVMNLWLHQERSATTELYRFLGNARSLIAAWVKQLDSGGGARMDASAVIAEAHGLLAGTDSNSVSAQVTSVLAPTPVEGAILQAAPPGRIGEAPQHGVASSAEPEQPNSEEAQIRIGNSVLSGALYEMYLGEAQQHLASLRDEMCAMEADASLQPQEGAVRAAHTLAGISGTVGLETVHDLGRSLEHALGRIAANFEAPTGDELEVFSNAVKVLEAMVSAVAAKRSPAPMPELLQWLDAIAPSLAVPPATEKILSLDSPGIEGFDEADLPFSEPQEHWSAARSPGESAVRESRSGASSNGLEEAVSLDEEDLDELEVQDLEAVALASVSAPSTISAESGREAPCTAPSRGDERDVFPTHNSALATTQEALADRRKLRLADDIDPNLLPIFLDEAADLLAEIGPEVTRWRAAPDALDAAQALARLLHTLKGSARMAGAMALGEVVHGVESRIGEALQGAPTPPRLFDECDAALDRVGLLLDQLRGKPGENAEPGLESQRSPASVVPGVRAQAAAAEDDDAFSRATLRVRADLIDRFVNEAGEITIARSRIEGEMRNLRGSLTDLTENVIRLRSQLRETEIQAESQMQSRMAHAEALQAEFDPLEMDRFTRLQELTRMLAESVNDVSTVQHNLLRNLDVADAALSAQGRLSRELQQALMNVRMVPFASIADRLHRIVRQTAKELNRKANLDIRGGQLELDRSVLEKITGPLEHLLRNAISHGLEDRETRLGQGKPEIGEIALTLAQEGNEIAIDFVDDGSGLNFDRIRERAVEAGLLQLDAVPNEADLIDLIFRPGFSTASQVSAISGRGVGMDVVRNSVYALGGRMEMTSAAGKGTRLRILLPQSLVVMQALLTRAGGRTYAIPSSMVEQVLDLKPDGLDKVRAAECVEWMDNNYPFRYLARLLGDFETQPPAARHSWIILARAGTSRVAFQVDELRGNQEIVIKKTGPQLARAVGVSGATVLADGEISVIVNPIALLGRERGGDSDATAAPVTEAAEVRKPTVMVVDDSLTVRKITGRLLEREGYAVITAKDGVDALEQLEESVPDVMLVDIEMPRMDGFDLSRNVRGDARLKHIPIIVITSRLAEKHRNYAKEIGVNHYLGKPYQEDELLPLIRACIAGAAISPP